MQAACWDLRVQPLAGAAVAARAAARGRGRPRPAQAAAAGQAAAGRAAAARSRRARSARAAAAGGGGGGGGFGGGGGGTAGPFVLPGIYNVALVVDGKTVETKPLQVTADPEVALTEVERKKMFDMAMEMHELQRRATRGRRARITPLNTRLAELAKEIAGQQRTCRPT